MYFCSFFDNGEIVLQIKSVSEKKSRGHRASKIVKLLNLPYRIVHFSTLHMHSMHDVACEFACPVTMRRNS